MKPPEAMGIFDKKFEKGYHSSRDETDSIPVTVVREVGQCYLLKRKSDGKEDLFPKSEVSFSRRNTVTGDAVADIPTWLLTKRSW